MTALGAFSELGLSKVAFSCPIPSFSKQIPSRGSARQSAAGKDAAASPGTKQGLCKRESLRSATAPLHRPGTRSSKPLPSPGQGDRSLHWGLSKPTYFDCVSYCHAEMVKHSAGVSGASGAGWRGPDPAPRAGKSLWSCVLDTGITTVSLLY